MSKTESAAIVYFATQVATRTVNIRIHWTPQHTLVCLYWLNTSVLVFIFILRNENQSPSRMLTESARTEAIT